jgi:hypothetical protein
LLKQVQAVIETGQVLVKEAKGWTWAVIKTSPGAGSHRATL